ncbi:inner membrane protein [Thalassobaculum fulvum]|uniref:Inner membrane protein n=1 Tax=Thalassobaculum fulvum TaxID=1633335 RepID=A0A918XY81_9PROT|nr:YbaN family protein [Thalassobaculum fulvum]GHD63293.1 inner membrane protein [Thalassobaculum fulvum]
MLGFVCTGLGIAGIVLPGLPGTVFLLVAVWAFSRSSERFHLWLYEHPRFGRTVRDWHAHRVIPVRAKIAAVLAMSATVAALVLVHGNDWRWPAVTAGLLAVVAAWIVTRPSRAADLASPGA